MLGCLVATTTTTSRSCGWRNGVAERAYGCTEFVEIQEFSCVLTLLMASYRLATLFSKTVLHGFLDAKPARYRARPRGVAWMFTLHVRLAFAMMNTCLDRNERVLKRVL